MSNSQTTTLFTIFLILASVPAVLAKDGEIQAGPGVSALPAFHTLTQTQLDRICQESVVGNFEPFFQGWIVKSLLGKKFMRPTHVNGIIGRQVQEHTRLLKEYLDSFARKNAALQKYSVLHFDLQMHHLVGTISRMAGVSFTDPFEGTAEVQRQVGEVPAYLDGLVSGVRAEAIDAAAVENYRHLFFSEYFGDRSGSPEELAVVLETLKQRIVGLLFAILDVYADPSRTGPYHRLRSQDKPLLQSFYDAFHPLIDRTRLREFVLQKTVGTDSIIHDGHPFFVEPMFRELLRRSPAFDGLIEKDRYLTVYDPRMELERFHGAAEHAMVSWPVLKAFEKPRYALLLDKSDASLEAKRGRKLVETYFNIYKAFVIARQTGVIRPEDPVELAPVMQKLFDWVVEGREFKAPQLTEEGQLADRFKEVKELMSREDYRRFYMPMLVELCKLIPGCQLGQRTDKPAVVAQFLALGDFGDLFKAEELFDFPKDLKRELEKEATVQDTKDFLQALNDQVDLNLLDPEALEDPLADTVDGFRRQEDEQPDERRKDALDSPRPKRARKDQKELEGLQRKFNDNFTQKFVPESGELDEDKKALLEKYVETVRTLGNAKKKNLSLALLFRFLLSLPADKPQHAALIDTVVNAEVTDFRVGANYETLDGLRNFLSRTMTPLRRYEPLVADDQFTYSLDLVSLLLFSTWDKIMKVSKDNSMDPSQKSLLLKRLSEQARRDEASVKLGAKSAEQLQGRQREQFQVRAGLMEMAFPASKRKAPANPLVLEKMMGLRLLYAVRGFFDYYAVAEEGAKAVAVDYHRVYLQFYQFVGHLRRVLVNEVHSPDEFVLLKLSECLELTRRTQQFASEVAGDSLCKFSHRKYAEMLFYYKAYLLGNNKLAVPLDSSAEGSFNVHTRNFIAFSRSNGLFQRVLTQGCPERGDLPICVSKRFFDEVLVYLSDDDTSKEGLERSIGELRDRQSTATKINVINGLEAAYLFVQHSSPVVYSKFSQFFEFGLSPKSPLKGLLSFGEGDRDGLAQYLSRTFKKLTISEHEVHLAKIVEAVLHYSTSGQSGAKDTLESFLVFGGHFVPYYVKLFLQYTVRDEHFALFADLLVRHGISVELIKINDSQDDDFYLSFVQRTKDLSKASLLTDGAALLRGALREKYSEVFQLCEESTRDSLMNTPLVADQEDEDMLSLLLKMDSESEQQRVEAEDSHFDRDLKEGINREIVSKRVALVMPAESTAEQILEQANVIKSQLLSEYQSSLGQTEVEFQGFEVLGDTDESKTDIVTDHRLAIGRHGSLEGPTANGLPEQTAGPSAHQTTIAGHQVPPSQAEMVKLMVQENMKQVYDKVLRELEAKDKEARDQSPRPETPRTNNAIEMTPNIQELQPPAGNTGRPFKIADGITLMPIHRTGLGGFALKDIQSEPTGGQSTERSQSPPRGRTGIQLIPESRFGLGGILKPENAKDASRERSRSPEPRPAKVHSKAEIEKALGLEPTYKENRRDHVAFKPAALNLGRHNVKPRKNYKI